MGDETGVAVYECAGIRVSSEIALSAPRSPKGDPSDVDAAIVLGENRTPPFERPSDDVVAELIVDGFPWYTFCRVDGGYVGRLPGIADFVISADLKRVVCHPVTDGRMHVLPIVIPGTVTAFLLAMSGRCVLHGSAVDLGGRAMAFVGASGQGKSTMAALFCAAGAALVTDDVLPLEFEPSEEGADSVYCLRSGSEIRLREKSASLVGRFGADVAVRHTADERRGLAPLATGHDRLPLAAIVLPRPSHDQIEVDGRSLTAGEASMWLARYQRIEGWRGRDDLRRQFVEVGRIVESVSVFEVSVPWGPPFAIELPEMVLAACGFEELSLKSF